MPGRPSGTVTFLFSDIEGSTKLWERYPDAMGVALARHDTLVRSAIESRDGHVFKTMGDAFCAAFATAPDALLAALAAQQALRAEPWGETGAIRVRMAIHTGAAEERGEDYFGQPLNRVARLLSAGHGEQVLLSLASQELARDHLPEGARLRDLGEHRLKDLSRPEHVYQLEVPGIPADFPPLRTLDNRPNNLPAQPTALVGRERELGTIRELLLKPEVRLVTLTGPGGTGKTRLGLQAAADSVDQFAGGVFFVPLAAITNADGVAPAIAGALGVRESAEQTPAERLHGYLREREVLLLLDNFEQVVSAAPMVAELLSACPRVKVLATSRESLRLRGEREYPVPPLGLPSLERLPAPAVLSQYEAVSLFIQRAVDVRPDFAVTNENAAAVAEICHRLEGLPLAIELAAARIKLFPPQAMLGRLSSRLALLTGGARDLPVRQQTLRNAVGWSYDLLEEEQKRLFRRLSVFVDGFTLPDAEAVLGPVGTDGLTPIGVEMAEGASALLDKSLLKQGVEGVEPRLQMLEVVREYGLERLVESGEGEATRRRHAEHFLSVAEKCEGEPANAFRASVLRLRTDRRNLDAAFEWLVTHGSPVPALRLANALCFYELPEGRYRDLKRMLERALAAIDDPHVKERVPGLLWLVQTTGTLAPDEGERERVLAMAEEARALAASVGNRNGELWALRWLALATLDTGRRKQFVEEHRARAKGTTGQAPEPEGCWENQALGFFAIAEGDLDQAEGRFRRLLDEHPKDFWTGVASHGLGEVAEKRGDPAGALAYYMATLPATVAVPDMCGDGAWIWRVARMRMELGDHRRSAVLMAAALKAYDEMGARADFRAEYLRRVETLRSALGEEACAAALEEGRRIGLDGAIRLAREP